MYWNSVIYIWNKILMIQNKQSFLETMLLKTVLVMYFHENGHFHGNEDQLFQGFAVGGRGGGGRCCIWVCLCLCVYVRVSVSVCMCVWVSREKGLCVVGGPSKEMGVSGLSSLLSILNMCVYTHTHTHTHTLTHTHSHTHTHTLTHTYINTHSLPHTLALKKWYVTSRILFCTLNVHKRTQVHWYTMTFHFLQLSINKINCS